MAPCVTVTDASPTRTVAVRSASVLASATNSADPSPVPLVWVPRSHAALLEACQGHADVAARSTVTLPPPAGTSTEDTFQANSHGAPSCRTDVSAPLTSTEAVRAAPLGFRATTMATTVSPCPVRGVIWSHAASDSTVHAHSRAVVIVAANSPPAAVIAAGNPVIDDPQRVLLGADNSETLVLPQAATAQTQSQTSR
jgi:hypothetical protein